MFKVTLSYYIGVQNYFYSMNTFLNFIFRSCKTIVGKDDFLECLNIENVEKKLFESNTLVFDDFSDKSEN